MGVVLRGTMQLDQERAFAFKQRVLRTMLKRASPIFDALEIIQYGISLNKM